jgi:23S rRNA (pseudouridine1915-N3)-methyltransferase
MKIKLLFTGKTRPAYLDQGVQDYFRRINHYTSLQLIEIQDLKKTRGLPQQKIMELEGDKILKNIQAEDFVILLDERGNQLSSVELAGLIEEKTMQSVKSLVYVTGGAFGYDNKVYDRSNMLLSVSKMTFSHQVIRILFLEQLYRAFTMIKGQPYHHG